jgi:hypothetical protein
MKNTRRLNIRKKYTKPAPSGISLITKTYYQLGYYTGWGTKEETFHLKEFDTLEEAKNYNIDQDG